MTKTSGTAKVRQTPRIKARRLSVTISETPYEWVVRWKKGAFAAESFDTAAEAIAYVRRDLKRLADEGVSSVCQIEWIADTDTGRRVVRALTCT